MRRSLCLSVAFHAPRPSHERKHTAAWDVNAVELFSFEGNRRLDGALFAFHFSFPFFSMELAFDREN